MKIGNIEINKKASLAPMAGAADRAFRELCTSYGAAFVVGELTSSKGVSMGDRKSGQLLSISDTERPAASQLFGDNPLVMAKAAEEALNFKPDFIDINMGCPAPKVSSNGCGSALMKNPCLAGEIVKAVVEVSTVPVTVKMRTGWDENSLNAPELARICEANGASMVTVHGRTKVQMYSPGINYDIIKEVKNSVKIPVIGNGDVTDALTAKEMIEKTGCDAVMVGRGALGKPWVFREINHYFETGEILPQPSIDERMNVLKKHISKLIEYKGEFIAMREARKHAAWYVKGIRGAAKYRAEIGKINTFSDLEELIDKITESCFGFGDTDEFDKFCFNNINR
ncbi:MAG: tRNA dihydrouridine synthase DusB [Clostridia bacterium]|nr:tRNA dihydrouridine synthase DusB [Clostridia bacterium]